MKYSKAEQEKNALFKDGYVRLIGMEINNENENELEDLKSIVGLFGKLVVGENDFSFDVKHEEGYVGALGFWYSVFMYIAPVGTAPIYSKDYSIDLMAQRFNCAAENAVLIISINDAPDAVQHSEFSLFFEATYELANKYYELIQSYKNKKSKNACFVATVVYDDNNCMEIRKLRHWRDNVLSNCSIGRLFIKIYYKYGEQISLIIKPHAKVKSYIKSVINQLVKKI